MEKNCLSGATSLLLTHQITLRFGAETLGACEVGRGDPIVDIKTILDHVLFFKND